MENFRAHITLETPAILHELLSLDALLAAALYRRSGDVEQAHSAIPLARTEGLWHGSSVILGRGHAVTISCTRRLRGRDWEPRRFTDQRKNGRVRVLTGGGRYRPEVDTYRGWAGEISFAARGEAEAVKNLLLSLPGIGAKARAGHGRIGEIEIEAIEHDESLCVAGEPRRPVPVRLCRKAGITVTPETACEKVRWAPPYWQGEVVACAVPRLF